MSWEDDYARSLAAWLEAADEAGLEVAYELGRAAIADERGLLDVVGAHQRALDAAMAGRGAGERDRRVTQAAAFLSECLAPFEMMLRGYREANSSLRDMNAHLEERVVERTKTLETAEERYRSLVEQLPGVTWRALANDPWRLDYVSPQVETLTGWTPEEWLDGVRPYDSIPAEDRQLMRDQLRRAMAAAGRFSAEHRLRRRDGRVIWVRDEARIVPGPEPHVQGITMDITEHRKLLEQVQRSQREESIGRLAGGVAHDFNNLLSIILSYAEIVLRKLPADEPMRREIEEIRKAGVRAADLTSKLLAYSRRQVLETRLVDLEHRIAEIGGMLRRIIGEDVKLELDVSDALPPVRVDPGQLEQVLLNLAVNARDAMPHGGTLTIATEARQLDEEAAAALGIAPGPYVMISVKDTGVGMTPEVRARVFEPFFTTKERGKGTGLGLATSFGIVSQSGGALAVESEPGHGATFRIWLPAGQGEADIPQESQHPARASSGTETILLVEDEAAVREVTARILREEGYHVLEAADGETALQASAAHAQPIDLLLTDVIMPGMGGKELAERVRAARPGIRVIFSSGYDEEAVARGLGRGARSLQKPVSPDALLQAVRDALDAPS